MDALAQFIQTTSHSKELKRALAVQMVQRQYPYREIQAIVQVSLGFISQWVEVYEQQGIEGLKWGYQGTEGYLNAEQRQEVIAWLKQRDCWQLEELVTHLDERYGVLYQSKQSYYDLFHQAGLSWKQSQLVRPQKDEAQVTQKNMKSWCF